MNSWQKRLLVPLSYIPWSSSQYFSFSLCMFTGSVEATETFLRHPNQNSILQLELITELYLVT